MGRFGELGVPDTCKRTEVVHLVERNWNPTWSLEGIWEVLMELFIVQRVWRISKGVPVGNLGSLQRYTYSAGGLWLLIKTGEPPGNPDRSLLG